MFQFHGIFEGLCLQARGTRHLMMLKLLQRMGLDAGAGEC